MHSLKKGFSLIELLVVIAIIGILAAVGTTGYQVYIDSTKLAVVKNNAATLLQAISNEDMAQSAGVGGYAECDDKDDLEGCVRAILAASTLTNPYDQNARYDAWNLFGISQAFAGNQAYIGVISSSAEGIIGEECDYKGEILFHLVDDSGTSNLSASYCGEDQLFVPHSSAGSKKMSFFVAREADVVSYSRGLFNPATGGGLLTLPPGNELIEEEDAFANEGSESSNTL